MRATSNVLHSSEPIIFIHLMSPVQARLMCSRTRALEDIRLPEDMGMDCGHYKWYQNQSFVELSFPLPEHTQPKEVTDSVWNPLAEASAQWKMATYFPL